MSPAIERLIAIDTRLEILNDEVVARVKERNALMPERSSILMGISWAERIEYEQWLMARAARPLDQQSAVRAVRAK